MSEVATLKGVFLEASKEIDAQIKMVLSSKADGFQKAFVVSSAVDIIRNRLTDEFMTPIMSLQGSNLGFKTDKDIDPKTKRKGPGYPVEIVRECLMEAIFLGLDVTGNQFNIIGGNMYPTREGFGALLDKIKGLKYNFTYKDIRQPAGVKVANVVVVVDYKIGDEDAQKQIIDFPIKSNEYTSYDALVGKAERKAKRWLFNKIKGTDISDGDVNEIPHVEVVETDNEKIIYIKKLKASAKGLTKDEEVNVNRIINTEEVDSYDKVITLLISKQ